MIFYPQATKKTQKITFCYNCGNQIKIGDKFRYKRSIVRIDYCVKCVGFMASRYDAQFIGGLTEEEDEERAKAIVYCILKSGLNVEDYVEWIN